MKRQTAKAKQPEKVEPRSLMNTAGRRSDFRGKSVYRNSKSKKFVRYLKVSCYFMFLLSALLSIGVWLLLTYGDEHSIMLLKTGYGDALLRLHGVKNRVMPLYSSISVVVTSALTTAVHPTVAMVTEAISGLFSYYLYLLKSTVIPLLLDWPRLAALCYQSINDTIYLILDGIAVLSVSFRAFFEAN
ncbi:hypothetical protein M513_06444 [Trichuris suis]|uniref:Uncharacterized protein n=1 Tax=Trichuris suis TaxID=68888 RepID=A0A085M5V1_9BILA|nr:hypothetical protein M513_06444 [Trichuris suis]